MSSSVRLLYQLWKAFERVWREGLWKVMKHLGYSKKNVRIVEESYEGTFSAVRVGGGLTESGPCKQFLLYLQLRFDGDKHMETNTM